MCWRRQCKCNRAVSAARVRQIWGRIRLTPAVWGPPSAQEEAEFREYAAQPNVLDLIPKRIAPQIFGSERIKEAVACLLFGGSRKVRAARSATTHLPQLQSAVLSCWEHAPSIKGRDCP